MIVGHLMTFNIDTKGALVSDESTLKELGEAFPAQGFSIEGDAQKHTQVVENLEAEMAVLNVLEYSHNAIDCMRVILSEAKTKQREAELIEA